MMMRKGRKLLIFSERNGLGRFWILNFYHTNKRTKRVSCLIEDDNSSHFGNVLYISETTRIQVEGTAKIWNTGKYKIGWRLKLHNDFFFKCIRI